jgi:GNAT superfamily N-acetyltransferase
VDVLAHVALDRENSDGGLDGHAGIVRPSVSCFAGPTVILVSVTIRERRPGDLPALVEVLSAQQSSSGYPHRWPLGFPVEEFIARPGELGSWVALVDGRVVGHVAATAVGEGWMAQHWSEVLGRPGHELGEVSILFVGLDHGGAGLGGALLERAVTEIRKLGLDPVLDVVDEDSSAGRFYRRRGWTAAGYARPGWLPDGHPDVAFMVLRDERVDP